MLQANLRKGPETQLCLLDDRSLQFCDFADDIGTICFLGERHNTLPYTFELVTALAHAAAPATVGFVHLLARIQEGMHLDLLVYATRAT